MNDHIPLNPYDEALLYKALEQSSNSQVVHRGSFAQYARSPLDPSENGRSTVMGIEEIRDRFIQPQSQAEALDPDAHYIMGEGFDRWLVEVRAKTKAEAFEEMASEPELMIGRTSYVSTDRLLERAKQLRKMIFNGKR